MGEDILARWYTGDDILDEMSPKATENSLQFARMAATLEGFLTRGRLNAEGNVSHVGGPLRVLFFDSKKSSMYLSVAC